MGNFHRRNSVIPMFIFNFHSVKSQCSYTGVQEIPLLVHLAIPQRFPLDNY